MDIVVQPSVSWMDLNEELAKRQSGLFFPVDPGPSKDFETFPNKQKLTRSLYRR
jgi:FAD/FMN-containing dehydrogenase